MAKKGKLTKSGSFRLALATYAGPGGGGGGGDASTLNGNAGTFYLDRANHTGPANFQDAIRLTGKITPPALVADTDDYNPTGLSTANVIFLSSSGNQDLTGIAAQEDGRVLYLVNYDAAGDNIKLKNNNANSLAANRFFIESDINIKPGLSVVLIYSTTVNRWLLGQTF